MTKDDIITLPHPSLRTKSKRVGVITKEIKQLVANMEAATIDWEMSREHEVGVALAAVQINKLFRVVVVRNDYNDKSNRDFTVLINPEITKYEGQQIEDYEGCLSVKNIYGKVPRYEKVRVKALDINGKPFRLTADGFLARIMQHEIDHTNGVVFVDHIKDKPEAFYRLSTSGEIEQLNYSKDIKNNPELWES